MMPQSVPLGSFRDPAGSLFSHRGRIYRAVNGAGLQDLKDFLASPAAAQWIAQGRLVRTGFLDPGAAAALLEDGQVRSLYEAAGAVSLVEHERIPFASFPYEWAPEMLHAAGLLTLELARDLLPDGFGLKDATPYNVLFRGPQAVFIDALSIERREPRDATWLPYAQFVRTFVLPLLAHRAFGLAPGPLLLSRRDGLEPEEVYRWTPRLKRLRPPFLSLISLPVWLGGRRHQDDSSIYRKNLSASPEKARFILHSLWNGLGRTMKRVTPRTGASSAWSDYMAGNNNYSAEHFQAKERFVQDALAEFRPKCVLDAGCNTGFFSRLAARAGASVVALDYDPVVVGEVWRNARAEGLDILPLVVDLTRPTPGTGWYNRECDSFLDRARGRFDAVFMLALIHHMLVTERIPLAEIVKLAADLTNDLAVIEFIGPEDSMFRRLTRGRDELHKHLTCEMFEREAAGHFAMVRRQGLANTHRWLYLLRKRAMPQ